MKDTQFVSKVLKALHLLFKYEGMKPAPVPCFLEDQMSEDGHTVLGWILGPVFSAPERVVGGCSVCPDQLAVNNGSS